MPFKPQIEAYVAFTLQLRRQIQRRSRAACREIVSAWCNEVDYFRHWRRVRRALQ